jgi:hypothetical protein
METFSANAYKLLIPILAPALGVFINNLIAVMNLG